MATPTQNSVPITALSTLGLSAELAALVDGGKWGGGYGTGAALTFSFPHSGGTSASYVSGYGGTEEEWFGSFDLNANEQAAVRAALNLFARSANLSFTEVPDNASVVGELRFTSSSSISSYAHAYTPSDGNPESGDVWFNGTADGAWNPEGAPVTAGSYEWLTIIHEVGHALGLKHPFESPVTLPASTDNYFYTVMSYTARAGVSDDVGADFYPTTLMYLDLAALQTLYGQSAIASPGNTVYTYQQNVQYWECINDSGGIDTVTYNAATDGGRIDLSGASFSRMGLAVNFDNGTSSRETISFGPGTIIEHANGGGGADTLIGNAARNRLQGNGGNDTLSGGAGNDTLTGGAGSDSMAGGTGNDIYNLNSTGDRVFEPAGGGIDTLQTSISRVLMANVERLTLTGAGNANGTGNALANLITGNAANNVLNGGAGADTVRGLGGNDTLVWASNDVLLDGGAGVDTLRVNGFGQTLDLRLIPDAKILNVEIIDITGSGNNTLKLKLSDVLAISSTGDTLRVEGNAGDTVRMGTGWILDDGDNTQIGSNFYETYTRASGPATLLVDTDITRLVAYA